VHGILLEWDVAIDWVSRASCNIIGGIAANARTSGGLMPDGHAGTDGAAGIG
jgi:hypothetical protein